LEGLAGEDAGILYGHLANLPAIWYILWHFGIFCGYLVYFPRFGILHHEKSGNPETEWKLKIRVSAFRLSILQLESSHSNDLISDFFLVQHTKT
jgi:hypothetical protein